MMVRKSESMPRPFVMLRVQDEDFTVFPAGHTALPWEAGLRFQGGWQKIHTYLLKVKALKTQISNNNKERYKF